MAWHITTDHSEIPVDDRSLTIAFANLLLKFGREHNPAALHELLTADTLHITWESLPDGVPDIELTDAGDSGWPPTSDAIVRFRRIDPGVGGMVDHCCLVADQRAHSIVDSLDGCVKPAAEYGEVLEWAAFRERETAVPSPDEFEEAWPSSDSAPKPGSTYTWVKDDNIWEVGRRLGFRPLELLEHNDIDDPRKIMPGDTLHLPEPRVAKYEPLPEIEVLPSKRLMHVTKQGGARKWLFGRARATSDLVVTGPRLREGANVDILAIAHVPLPDEYKTVDFYIDPVAFGNYQQTGRLRYTIGFDPADLEDGHIEKTNPLPKVMAATVEKIGERLEALNNPPETPTVSLLPQLRPILDVKPGVSPSKIKETIHPLLDGNGERLGVTRFVFLEGMEVLELDHRGKPVQVAAGDLVDTYLGVYKDGQHSDEHLVPLDHDVTGYFYLIPRDKVMPYDEFYSPEPTPGEVAASERYRQQQHRLTAGERYYWAPFAFALSRVGRIKTQVSNKYKGVNHHGPKPTTRAR